MPPKGSESTVRIEARGPYSWEQTREFLESWPATGIEAASGARVTMSFVSDSLRPAAAVVSGDDSGIDVSVFGESPRDVMARQVARTLSLDHDATSYPEVSKREPAVGAVMERLRGLRPVIFPSPYECAVWGILSQRIAQAQARRIKQRIAEEFGEALQVEGERVASFPTPDRLLEIDELPSVPPEKLRRLHGIARATLDGELDPATLSALPYDEAKARLKQLPGIGDFWAAGIYVRACGVTDVFPEEPLAIRALATVRGLEEVPTGEALQEVTTVYSPWRTWVCVLLRVAAARGIVPGVPRSYRQ